MTAATDTDSRELKTAVETIAKSMEANTKAIAELTTSVNGLREEMRLGFANIDTRFAKVEGQINTIEAKLTGKIDKIDERTRLGFWGVVLRGTALAALIALIAIFVTY